MSARKESAVDMLSAADDEAGFMTICRTCGTEFKAPGNCTDCGMAFHF